MADENIRFALKLIYLSGLHPDSRILNPISLISVICSLSVICLLVYNMLLDSNGQHMEIICYGLNIVTRIVLLLTEKEKLKKLLATTKFFWKDAFSDSQAPLSSIYFKYLKFYPFATLLPGVTFFIKPLMLNSQSILDCYYPKNTPFLVPYVLEVWFLFFGFVTYFGSSVLICTLIVQLYTQFYLLQRDIQKIDLSKISNHQDLLQCLRALKKDISYHNFLTSFVEEMKRFLYKCLFQQLIINVVLLCVNLYFVTYSDSIFDAGRNAFGWAMVIVEIFFLYGLPAQFVTDYDEGICNTIYCDMDWYLPNMEHMRKYLLIMMVKAQRPVRTAIEGLMVLNVRTVLLVFQASYSFYTFLTVVTKK